LVARPSGNPAESEIAICHPIAAVAGVNQQSMHKFRAARRHLIHREIIVRVIFRRSRRRRMVRCGEGVMELFVRPTF
jgi:hypothetical protein